jgi:hypothetical protein
MEKILDREFDIKQMRIDARNRVVNVFDENRLMEEFLKFYAEYI